MLDCVCDSRLIKINDKLYIEVKKSGKQWMGKFQTSCIVYGTPKILDIVKDKSKDLWEVLRVYVVKLASTFWL